MELLILLALSPAILAQRYEKSNDPNNEPFLPIYPVYPYSPKLIKRGTEREAITQLTPELYAPKVDARDSYTASFSTNYPRDPYYPNYNPYPKLSSSSSYSSYYNSPPYTYSTTTPYNSYSPTYTMTPPSYSTIPYSSSYPSYYYQPYYYPNYYSQPMFPPPPSPPPNADYSSDSYSDNESSKNKEKNSNGNRKTKDNDANQDSGSQFVDGGNYISGNSKDLDSQPSTYKVSSPQNQLDQVSDLHIKNLPIPLPKTTYRVISVAGQPVGPDYPLPDPYVKAQQLEELMSQTWTKILNQNAPQSTPYPYYEMDKSTPKSTDISYGNQNDYNTKESQRYVSVPNILAKTGLAYVLNPNILAKINPSLLGQPGGLVQQPTVLAKSTKYSTLPRHNSDHTQGQFAVPEKPDKDDGNDEQNDYRSYDNQAYQSTQAYDQGDNKQTQNYENDQGQPGTYQSQSYGTMQTPQGYNYQYTSYNPTQIGGGQQTQQYKTNLEDVNFGAKQMNKG